MKLILKKEIISFFSYGGGFIILLVYILVNGLFLWVFENNFNILSDGFADLVVFFYLMPWVFMFIIPAVTMRSFSEEQKTGTIELLITKPFSKWDLVLGKFIGNLIIVILILSTSVFYITTIWKLGLPEGNLPIGSVTGSYIGLIFLLAVYTSVGILCSAMFNNQTTAFITSLISCFTLFYGFNAISELNPFLEFVEYLSLKYHYESISRGVIDTRDIIYFMSLTIFLIKWTHIKLYQTYR